MDSAGGLPSGLVGAGAASYLRRVTTTLPPTRPLSPVRARGPWPWAVLVAAVLQVVAPVVTALGPGAAPGAGSGPELAITPVGWAFAIWGVIYTLALVQAVLVLVKRVEVPQRFAVDQVVLYLAGAAWIVVAAFETSLGTAAALVVMAVAAIDGVLTLARAGGTPAALVGLTRAAFGLYAGWVTAALFLNLASALASTGAVDPADLPWQAAFLVVAAAVLVVVTLRSGGSPAYAAAGVWALFGISVTTAGAGDVLLLVLAVLGAVAVVAAAPSRRLHARAR